MALDDKTKQGMESGLEYAVRVVQARFVRLEQTLFIPCLESSRNFAQKYPITSTFIGIFFVLGIFPVASFCGFAILVSATLFSIALLSALLASTVLIIAAAAMLAFTLSALFLTSLFLTAALVSLFITIRLGHHLYLRGGSKEGIVNWAHETCAMFRWRVTASPSDNGDETIVKELSRPSGSEEWQAVNGG